jgi:hypothetical protein
MYVKPDDAIGDAKFFSRSHDIFCCWPVWKSARDVPLANEPIEKRIV